MLGATSSLSPLSRPWIRLSVRCRTNRECRQTYDCAIMKDIRLRWVTTRNTTVDGQPVDCGPWCLDTEASRSELGEIFEAGLQVCGEGSHWIQERESEKL
jgi:hypothetical protein